jgi:hypothetical protein
MVLNPFLLGIPPLQSFDEGIDNLSSILALRVVSKFCSSKQLQGNHGSDGHHQGTTLLITLYWTL